MASFLFSNFFTDAANWTTHNSDYNGTLLPLVSIASTNDRNVVSRAIVNMSEHTPTLVAFVDS